MGVGRERGVVKAGGVHCSVGHGEYFKARIIHRRPGRMIRLIDAFSGEGTAGDLLRGRGRDVSAATSDITSLPGILISTERTPWNPDSGGVVRE